MQLLSIDDIAEVCQVSRRYARDVLVKSPGFPLPVLSLSQKTRRWTNEDVQQWVFKRKEMLSR